MELFSLPTELCATPIDRSVTIHNDRFKTQTVDFMVRGRLRYIAISGYGLNLTQCGVTDHIARRIDSIFCQQNKSYFQE